MESSKYYTPEIEEFYVGFECEKVIPHSENGHQISLTNMDQKSFIIKNVYDIPRDKASLSWFKVKYLNKEDIKSLGFKFSEQINLNGTRLCFNSLKYRLDYLPENNHLIIQTNDYIFCKFNGRIKNKSELIKLLKQLSID